jgi:hypothetical protein
MFFAITSQAATWGELREGQNYELLQNFQLKQQERSHSLVEFLKGEKFLLKEIISLEIPGVLVTLFTFDYKNCPGPELSTELEIIPVKEINSLVEFGAQVEKCELNIYLETKDSDYKSIFE